MPVGSIQHCRAFLESSTLTSKKCQSLIDGMSELSPVSLKIFQQVCVAKHDAWKLTDKMSKITSCPLLQQEFIELKKELSDAEKEPSGFKFKQSLKTAMIGLVTISWAYAGFQSAKRDPLVNYLQNALGKVSDANVRFAPLLTIVPIVIGTIGALAVNDSSALKMCVKKQVDAVTTAARNLQDKVRKFEELFQDKELVEVIKTELTKVISDAPKDSVQQKTHQVALAELKKCADFCTVFART